MKLKNNKKGYTVGDLLPLGITFVVLAIALSFCADIVNDIQDTQTVNGTAWNISGAGLNSVQVFADWLPTIALVVVAAIIVGIIIVYLARRFT